jgi:hypothetical protein
MAKSIKVRRLFSSRFERCSVYKAEHLCNEISECLHSKNPARNSAIRWGSEDKILMHGTSQCVMPLQTGCHLHYNQRSFFYCELRNELSKPKAKLIDSCTWALFLELSKPE